jgi:hypothetical protein
MDTLVSAEDLRILKNYFGKELKVLSRCWCDINSEELIRVNFPCEDSLSSAFWLGRIIQNEKLMDLNKWAFEINK